MKYKMVILDMDGTLLDNKGQVSEDNRKILHKLHCKGIKIVIATGRRYLLAKPIISKLGIPAILVSNSGNSLWKLDNDQSILIKLIPAATFYKIVQEGRRFNLHPVLHVDHFDEGYDYFTEYEEGHPSYHSYIGTANNRHKQIGDFMKYSNPRVMLICYLGDIEILRAFQNHLKENFQDQIHTQIILAFKRVGPLLEITSPTGTKWHTVKEYAASLNIKPEEIIAIGDDNNDMDMIRHAGLGIAMKNAIDEVKKAADMVTDYSNDESGVARVLEKLLEL